MDWSTILSGLFGAGAQSALANYGVNQVQQAGKDTASMLSGVADQAQAGLQFKPYTVTTGGAGGGLGSFTAGPTGTAMELSPDYQQLVQQLTGAGMGQLMGSTGSIDSRASDITSAMEAASAPSRERERLALEERLLGQGRLGVQTAQYGGTPEQLALSKAIEEQRMNNTVMGRQQAMGEQLQQYNIGQGLFQNSFTPQQMLLNTLQGTQGFAELSNRMQQQQAVTGAELATRGGEAQMQGEQMANVLRQTYLQKALEGLLAGNVSADGSSQGSILSGLFGNISDMFGGGAGSAPLAGTPTAQQIADYYGSLNTNG